MPRICPAKELNPAVYWKQSCRIRSKQAGYRAGKENFSPLEAGRTIMQRDISLTTLCFYKLPKIK